LTADAVAPDDKKQARRNVIAALDEVDWGSKAMMVRIHGLDTHYMYRDVVDIVETRPRLDMILIPKVGVANDVFTPSDAEVTKARRILAAMDQAAKEGRGAVSLDGRLIDIASIRMAQALIDKANAIGTPAVAAE
jgi:citrate lyase beta subunit